MRFSIFILGIGLALSGAAHAAETRGLSVQLRASEAKDAAIVETVELYSKSYALVIGNDSYRDGWARLGQARNDARKVAKALKARGFEVTLKTDLKSTQMETVFKEFFLRKGQDPNARLFIWYAGHGHTQDGEGFLIPVNGTSPDNRIDFLSTALSLRRFGEFVRLAKSKHVFTIFDSCFAGTIFNVARANETPPQITRITTQPVRQFLTSGDAGQTVADNGTFADLFIEALAGQRRADPNADGYLTASELGAFLDSKMSNLTNNRQTPRYGKLQDKRFDKGDFVFQLAAANPTLRHSRPRLREDRLSGDPGVAANAEVVFWQSIQNSERASDYGAYLSQYPKGSFAALARSRLSGLKEKKVASLSPPSFVVEGLDETLVALRSANVRKLPTASSSKVTTLKVGSAVEVTGKTRFEGKDWYRVAVSGRSAYVYGSLLGKKATPAVSRPPKVKTPPKATPAVGVYPSLAPGKTFRDCAECPEMVVIPSGRFLMGDLSGAGYSKEKPVHEVRIGYSFAAGKYEVTQDEWVAVMGGNRSQFKGGRNPVDNVSWKDARVFVSKLNSKTGKEYRLLSEAEWEYMARAGSTSKYPWGNGIDRSKAKYHHEREVGTVAVGLYERNSFGVHDTVGNVWEWTEDCWHQNYSGAPSDGSAWTTGIDCSERVLRGGSWHHKPRIVRSAYRGRKDTTHRHLIIGFRVARTLSR